MFVEGLAIRKIGSGGAACFRQSSSIEAGSRHAAPLELVMFFGPLGYKHFAPLGLFCFSRPIPSGLRTSVTDL
jgi:hypothetical protein